MSPEVNYHIARSKIQSSSPEPPRSNGPPDLPIRVTFPAGDRGTRSLRLRVLVGAVICKNEIKIYKLTNVVDRETMRERIHVDTQMTAPLLIVALMFIILNVSPVIF